MFKLIIEDDEGKTTVVPITRDEITVGRKEGNNIRLTERNVSRQHARFSRQNGTVFIEDLDSYNGVRINGDRISVKTPVQIQVGDLIEIGDYHLAIQLEGADAPALATAGDESTQRVAMPAMEATTPGTPAQQQEITTRAPAPAMAPAPVAPAPAAAPAPAPAAHVSGPSGPAPALRPSEPTPDPEDRPRAEPTAIIRTTDLAAAAAEDKAPSGARLVAISTSLAGMVIPLTRPETSFGRTDDNDVQLDHRSVSRNHAKVTFDGMRYSVVDLKSANGVLVNGNEFKRTDLRRGDIIELGHVKLRFVEPGEDFSLSPEEVERLRKEEPAEDAFGDEPTHMVNSRSAFDLAGLRKAAPGGVPIKLLAAGVGAAVLGVLLLVMMLSGGDDPPPVTVASSSSGGQVASSAAEVEPPPTKAQNPPPDRTPPPSKPDKDPARILRSAQAAFRAGDFSRARSLALQVAANDEARSLLEKVERELKAKAQLDDAMDRKRKDPEAAYRGLESVMDGTRARDRADQEMRSLKPALVQRHLREAERAISDGNFQKADAALEDADALDVNNRDVGRLRDRLARARNRKANPPDRPERSGNNRSGEAKKALEDCNRAILLGNFEDAVAKGKLAIRLDGSLTEAHKFLGVAYARQQKYCDAKYHYKKFIELNPNNSGVDRIKAILSSPDLNACP